LGRLTGGLSGDFLAEQLSSQDHHYVPQLYTRRWADETESSFVGNGELVVDGGVMAVQRF